MAQLWERKITLEETDISLWSLLCHLPAAISGDTVKTRETQSQFCKTASMWTNIKNSVWHGSLTRNFCPIQTPQYVSSSLCASLHWSSSQGPVDECFPPKIICSYGLIGTKGAFHEPFNVSHAQASSSRKVQGDTHLIFNDLKVLIKVHNSKFHCRYKKKHSKAFWLQHVLAQTCISFSVLQYPCLPVYLRATQVFSQTTLPSISHPKGLCLGGFYTAVHCRNPLPLPGKITKLG